MASSKIQSYWSKHPSEIFAVTRSHYNCITSALQVVHYKLCITSCALQYHFYVNFPISLKLVKLGIYTDVRRTEEVSSHCSYIFLDLL